MIKRSETSTYLGTLPWR